MSARKRYSAQQTRRLALPTKLLVLLQGCQTFGNVAVASSRLCCAIEATSKHNRQNDTWLNRRPRTAQERPIAMQCGSLGCDRLRATQASRAQYAQAGSARSCYSYC